MRTRDNQSNGGKIFITSHKVTPNTLFVKKISSLKNSRLIAHTSALEMTQLSNVLITDIIGDQDIR